MLWISGADCHDPAAQLPSYHYFKMLIDPSYEPPLVAQFDDEVRLFVLHPFVTLR